MDFSLLPGKQGYVLYKLGIIRFWQHNIVKHYHLPIKKYKNTPKTSEV